MSQNPVFGYPISKPPILSDFHAAARKRELSKRIEAPYFMVTFTWKLCFVTASTDPGHPP
jgi:hypothetical protein